MTTPQDTSAQALASVTPAIPTIRQRIYSYIHERGANGATADEIEAALNIPGSTVRPRLRELEFDLAEIVLTPATRLTRRGRKACVYQAVPNAY
jgi:predicted transcriptional regulator